jgi:transcriptional regulator with XRE-family HTH domain
VSLGERIRQLRTRRGLSQRQLGELAGVSYTYLSKIENARLDAPPSIEVLRSLAGTLRVDELELLSLTDHLPADLTMFVQNPDATRFFRRAAQIQPSSNDWREMFEYMEMRAAERGDDALDASADRYGEGRDARSDHSIDGTRDGRGYRASDEQP